jgi:hypothetical protein
MESFAAASTLTAGAFPASDSSADQHRTAGPFKDLALFVDVGWNHVVDRAPDREVRTAGRERRAASRGRAV